MHILLILTHTIVIVRFPRVDVEILNALHKKDKNGKKLTNGRHLVSLFVFRAKYR